MWSPFLAVSRPSYRRKPGFDLRVYPAFGGAGKTGADKKKGGEQKAEE